MKIPLSAIIGIICLVPFFAWGAEDRCASSTPAIMPCFKAACQELPSYKCDQLDEMKQILSSCQGNYGDLCLKHSFKYLSSYKYDDLTEMSALAASCQGVKEVECIDLLCSEVGAFGCNDLEEMVNINRSCAALMTTR